MRFDLFRMPARQKPGYLLDVQADVLSDLPTRMVVPVLPNPKLYSPLRGLHPAFEVSGDEMIMMTHELASVPRRILQRPVMSLAAHRDDIIRALDLLFTGF